MMQLHCQTNILKGFTLLEALLSIALLSILASMMAAVTLSFYQHNELINAANITTSVLRNAQSFAIASEQDAPWGVKYIPEDGDLVIFAGNSYALRKPGFDEPIIIPDNIDITGLDEIVFDELYGTTSDYGQVTLTGVSDRTITIEINRFGNISIL